MPQQQMFTDLLFKAYEAQFLQKYSIENAQLPSRVSFVSVLPPFTHNNVADVYTRSDILSQLKDQLDINMKADLQNDKLQSISRNGMLEKTDVLVNPSGIHGIHASSIANLRQKAKTFGFHIEK